MPCVGKFNQSFDTQLLRQFINPISLKELTQIRKTIMVFLHLYIAKEL